MRLASRDLLPAFLLTTFALTAGASLATAPGCTAPERSFGAGGGGATTSSTASTSTSMMSTTSSEVATGGKGGSVSTGGGGMATGGMATGGAGTGGMATGGAGTGGMPGSCNPFTSATCDIVGGFACDVSGTGFQCFGPPNDEVVCAPCQTNGLFCQPGMTCHQTFYQCVRFCCIDVDCGTGNICDHTAIPNATVGVCVAANIDGGAPTGPACNVPVVQPSGGSCFVP